MRFRRYSARIPGCLGGVESMLRSHLLQVGAFGDAVHQ